MAAVAKSIVNESIATADVQDGSATTAAIPAATATVATTRNRIEN
jgi:hypothetical protein